MPSPRETSSCLADARGRCQSYAPGHHVHAIHAKHVGRTPWGWRDGVVTRIEGLSVSVRYLLQDHDVQAWHHEDLAG